MNFVLIKFLATLVVGTFLVVTQFVCSKSHERQKGARIRNRFSFNIKPSKEIVVMDKMEGQQSAQGLKGLQQRRSHNSLIEQEQMDVPQAVEMCRTSSSQSSLGSDKSTCTTKSGGSRDKEFTESKIPGQPSNFGTVVPGVYRSSYPQEADYPFLEKLGLKTIV